MLIDTHLHLIDRQRISYQWLSQVPALDRDWTYAAYELAAKRIGILKSLHMEVDVDPAYIGVENSMIAELMALKGSLVAGAISSARPEDEGFEAFVESLDPDIVLGIRRVLHVAPDEVSQSRRFRANVKLIGQHNLTFDICALQRQLPIAAELIDSCPNTQFVLDHCGVPDIAGDGFEDWSRSISDIASRTNVVGKISGISAYAKADWTLETLRPYVEHMVRAFGWDRLVWGSDSPVCTLNSNLEQWVATTHALFSDVSDEERNKLYSGNARRIWNLTD